MKLTGQNKTAAQAAGVVLLMGTLAWASVPFYNWFCRVTGFGGTPSISATGSETVLEETIIIRFDASLGSGMPWSFKPVQQQVEVRIGETGLAFYEATNLSDRPVAGQASYNVVPYAAGGFFTKIECFCFTEQILQPGESVLMPVSYYVDPAIVDDREGKFVHTITLSYTFFEIDMPEQQAALTSGQSATINTNQEQQPEG